MADCFTSASAMDKHDENRAKQALFCLLDSFLSDRCLQVVEAGLGHLPFTERSVITPTGRPYTGVDFAKKLCGVSIIRSGEAFENALRACCKGIKIGKILIHR